MSMNSATLETTLTHAAGSEMRSGPVLVGAGGHGVAATVRAGALIAKRLGREMTLLSVIEPVPGDVWDADGTFWRHVLRRARRLRTQSSFSRHRSAWIGG